MIQYWLKVGCVVLYFLNALISFKNKNNDAGLGWTCAAIMALANVH